MRSASKNFNVSMPSAAFEMVFGFRKFFNDSRHKFIALSSRLWSLLIFLLVIILPTHTLSLPLKAFLRAENVSLINTNPEHVPLAWKDIRVAMKILKENVFLISRRDYRCQEYGSGVSHYCSLLNTINWALRHLILLLMYNVRWELIFERETNISEFVSWKF